MKTLHHASNPQLDRNPITAFRYRFVALFGVITLLLASMPFVGRFGLISDPMAARLAIAVLFDVVLISAVFVVSRSHRIQIITIALAVPAMILQSLSVLLDRDAIFVSGHVLCIVFLGYTVCILLAYLFTAKRVDVNTICASLCVYLLLAVLWAFGYSLLGILVPGSFSFPNTADGESVSMRFGGEGSAFTIYYSFVTMTTLGYGDIVPATPPARLLAAFQAVVGQLYLTVLVARLVGMHISQSTQRVQGPTA